MLMSYVQKPSLHYCGVVAKALTDKCEFLKDNEGDGEVSFANSVYAHFDDCTLLTALLEVVFVL